MSVNTFFSRPADRIFLTFHIKLEAPYHQNLRKPNFSEKWGKAPQIPQNRVFRLFPKIRSFDVSLFNPENGTLNVVYDSQKASSLGKAWSQNDTKPIRLQIL